MPFSPVKPGGWSTNEILTSSQISAIQSGLVQVSTDLAAGGINVEFATASGTWNKPTNAKLITIILVGAGGKGADINNSGTGGGGGGAGHLAERTFEADTVPATLAITIGTSSGAATTAIGTNFYVRAGGGRPGVLGVGGNGSSGGGAGGLDGSLGGAGGANGSDGSPSASGEFAPGNGIGYGAGRVSAGGAASPTNGSAGGGAAGPLAGTLYGGPTASTGGTNEGRTGGSGGTGYGAGGGGAARGSGSATGGSGANGVAIIITQLHKAS